MGQQKEDEGAINLQVMPVLSRPLACDVIGRPRQVLDEIVESIDSVGIFTSMGVVPDQRFVFYGVPGTGKSHLVEALNNQVNCDVLNEYRMNKIIDPSIDGIPVQNMNLAVLPFDLGKMGTAYINRGALKIQRYFDAHFKLAEAGIPSLAYIDECDVLFRNRLSNMNHGEDNKNTETFMKNMHNIEKYPSIKVVMATNLVEILDGAATRAGRIDKKYEFKLPDIEQRVAAYDLFANQVNEKANYQVVRRFDSEELASLSTGFNYPDMKAVVTNAVRHRAQEAARDKTPGIMPACYVTGVRMIKELEQHKKVFVKKDENRKIGF